MKKILIALIIIVSFSANAQKSKEIRIDVFDILVLKTLDLTYEIELNSESAFGLGLLFNFDDKSKFYDENFIFSPYYRQNLFYKGNVVFFGEFFGALNTGKNDIANPITPTQIEEIEYTDFAFGLSFGGKYVSAKGFVLDFHGGIGRNLFSPDSPEVLPRVGISVGKSF